MHTTCLIFYSVLLLPPKITLFPYTTLFRSRAVIGGGVADRGTADPVPVALERHAERSEEHTSELQSPDHLVCRLLLEKKKRKRLDSLYIMHLTVWIKMPALFFRLHLSMTKK